MLASRVMRFWPNATTAMKLGIGCGVIGTVPKMASLLPVFEEDGAAVGKPVCWSFKWTGRKNRAGVYYLSDILAKGFAFEAAVAAWITPSTGWPKPQGWSPEICPRRR
jgi:hypothetical protein